jgi:hypothetical protein
MNRFTQVPTFEALPLAEKEGFEPSIGAKSLAKRDSTHSASPENERG